MWKWFSGKKVVIGTVFFLAAMFGQEVLVGIWELWPKIMPQAIKTCQWFATAFGVVGLGHKVKKAVMIP